MKKGMIFIFVFYVSIACSQVKKTSSVAFYNVENLFDTINDPTKNDEDFLPNGRYSWTTERYDDHVKKLAQVMDDMGDILVLGVSEVENAQVMYDLLAQRKNNKLGVVHYDSEDARGVDVGLFYDSIRLKLQTSGYIRFKTVTTDITTRDIVWAKFGYKKEHIYLLVNHWPSRRGGAEASEPNRVKAADLAVNFIDSVQAIDPNAKFIFMGDLNDHPEDAAPKKVAERLTPMIHKTSGKYGGTYNYRGEWGILDHILVSPSLLRGKKIKVIENSGEIISYPYLIEQYKGEDVPFRVYAGSKYLGGYSDHFPVRIKVLLK